MAIVLFSRMIDPQAQAIKWIKNMEMSNNLRLVDLQTPDYLRIIEECIRQGRPCLCQNVKEDLDPSLDPVLTRAVKRIGGVDILKLGDREVEYNKNFRFYMTTKLPNPHYAPEISSKANIINFAVKEQGLESQLLGIVVGAEKPELEEDKDKLVRGIATGKKKLIELEDQLLRLLNETKGSLLENDELLSTLEISKQTAKTVQEQLITSEATEKDIDAAREVGNEIEREADEGKFVIEFRIIDLVQNELRFSSLFSMIWVKSILCINSLSKLTLICSKIRSRRVRSRLN